MDRSVRLAGICYESLVNGPGLRRVFFAQGCRHNCKGCFNPSTHCLEGGELRKIDELIEDLKSNPMIKGITFSGGDPFEQAEEFSIMAQEMKKLGLNIWCYTGYTFEYILEHKKENKGWEQFLSHIDILVDGKYEEDIKDDSLKYRGSRNQRIIKVQESIKSGQIIIEVF